MGARAHVVWCAARRQLGAGALVGGGLLLGCAVSGLLLTSPVAASYAFVMDPQAMVSVHSDGSVALHPHEGMRP